MKASSFHLDSAPAAAPIAQRSGARPIRTLLGFIAAVVLTSATPVRAQSNQPTIVPDLVLAGTMAELTSPEVDRAAKEGAIVLFPVAIIEEHGPHLDLTPDIVLAAESCRSIKARLEQEGTKVVIVPPLYWGVSFTTQMFPGTFAVKPETMKAVLTDAIGCLKNWGFQTIILVNGHGDPTHRQVQTQVAADLRQSLGIGVYAAEELNPEGFTPPPFPGASSSRYTPDYHAGAPETAAMAVLRPTSVRPAIAKQLKPQAQFAPLGYVGNPAGYDAVDGREILNFFAAVEAGRISAFLKQQRAAKP